MNEHDKLCDAGIHNFKGIRKQIGWKDQYTAEFEKNFSLIRCKNCDFELDVDTAKKLLSLGKLSLTTDELLKIIGDTT